MRSLIGRKLNSLETAFRQRHSCFSKPTVGMDLGMVISQIRAAAEQMARPLNTGLYTFPLYLFIMPFFQTQLFLLLFYIFFYSSNNFFFF